MRRKIEPRSNKFACAAMVAGALNRGRDFLVSGFMSRGRFNTRGCKIVEAARTSTRERTEIFCIVRTGTPTQRCGMAGQSIRCSGPALAEEKYNKALCCIDIPAGPTTFDITLQRGRARAGAEFKLKRALVGVPIFASTGPRPRGRGIA